MASGDFARFLPSESAYVNPGEYESTQRAIALQNATYQSQMDTFYKELEERKREFDIGFGLEEKKLGLEEEKFGETQRQFDVSAGLEKEKLGLSKWMFTEEQGLREAQLEEQKSEFAQSLEQQQTEFEAGKEQWSAQFLETVRQFNEQLKVERKKVNLQESSQEHDTTMDWIATISTLLDSF
jgi:hypothetical protein